MNGYGITAQGFQGSLGLPRELNIVKTHNVSAPVGEQIEALPAIWEKTSRGTYTATTLGSRPLPDLVEALHTHKPFTIGTVRLAHSGVKPIAGYRGDHFHLKASMHIDDELTSAGFFIRATPDMEE